MVEVGEHVRTNDGHIGKLIRIERDDIDTSLKWYVFDDGKNERYVNKPYIVNHSKNIIDLIEVGDIVHTRDVLNEDIVYIWSEEYLKALKEDLKNGIELVDILTFEQYTKNCYTVERVKNEN